MLCKSIVRSTADYGSFIYAPQSEDAQLKIERSQFLGIRTALSYRNSTPNNVITAEAKLTYLSDIALMLAKTFALEFTSTERIT